MKISAGQPWPGSDDRRADVVSVLVTAVHLDPALVARAQLLAARTGRPTEQVLNQMGVVSDHALAAAYAKVCGCHLWDPEAAPPLEGAAEGLQSDFLKERRVIPLRRTAGRLYVAACDPLDDEALAGLAFATGLSIEVFAATPSDYRRAAGDTGAEAVTAATDERRLEMDVQRVVDVGADSDSARLLSAVLETAVARRASDIHIEPRRHDMRVRLRIDGQLVELQTASLDVASSVTSRLKVLANLDVGERRLPQDGRATFVVAGRNVEARLSTVPTVFGESAVLRILDRVGIEFDLESLGVAEQERSIFDRAIRAPHGIFFITGPTGSGKTTTLYALLSSMAEVGRKILSIEDPVEHHFAHVSQVQVAPQIGLTFASALRAFLRQDPDVILVGEVRDRETAAVAVQAAMTGHLVLASVHANDAVRVVPRMIDMGVEPYQLAAALLGAAAQRLVRRLCPHCRQLRSPTEAELVFASHSGWVGPLNAWEPGSCGACAGVGYRGRIALVEGYLCREQLSAAVAHAAPLDELRNYARADGLRSMALDGLAKSTAGLTTLSDVMATLAE